MMTRKQSVILAGAAIIAAAGLGTGVTIATTASSGQPASTTSAPAASGPGYAWYQSMMTARYGSSTSSGMMGSSSWTWMMSQAGYRWMSGSGTTWPGWMTGSLPPAMMSAGMMSTGTGTIMGSLFASAPGPRISAAQATAAGQQVPAGAQVSTVSNTITFTTSTVQLTVLASPAGGPGETFRAAGLVNPHLIVPVGARVGIQLINADTDMAHGLIITAGNATAGPMPMMTARPAFTGSDLWFLGDPTPAGLHEGTLSFTATSPGSYHYLCPVPGHARDGMIGTLTIQ